MASGTGMKFLVFGDVVGKPGREAINRVLPEMREQYKPDSVIINIENIASNGMGVSIDGYKAAMRWQADVYTTGDHAWDNARGVELLETKGVPMIRPANYPEGTPGRGYYVYTNGAYRVAVINLQGQVFFKNHPTNPFHKMNELLEMPDIKEANIVLVDFQADATSEKRGMGWHLDGRVSAMWGTHTHVPTADAQRLPEGTGYITDVGLNGNLNSVIGFDRAQPLKNFLTQIKGRNSVDDVGPFEIGALYLEINPQNGKTEDIAHVRKILKERS